MALGSTRTASASAESSGQNHRADIQGLRAIAVVVVMLFHAGLPVPGGFVGVDIFFVISGFVITAMLAREWARSGAINFQRFYARRFRRLTPALALLVAVTMVISAILQSPLGAQQIAAKTGLGAILITANIVIARTTGGYFDAPAAANPLLNTWSLSVEEQFYLIFPLVLAIAWWLARRGRRTAWAPVLLVGLVGAISLGIALLQATGHHVPVMPQWLGGFYGPASRAWEFAAGALLALFAGRLAPWVTRGRGLALGVVGLIGLAVSLWFVTAETPWPGPLTLIPVIGTMALLAAGLGERNAITATLGLRPFVLIGDTSYSLYLWHWPFVVFAVLLWPHTPGIAVIAVVASILPAAISYRWVEQPIRALRNLSRRQMVVLVTATLVPPIALAVGLLVASNNGFWNARVQQFVASVAPMHAGNAAGCNTSTPPSAPRAKDCRWNAAMTGTPVYLIGDSHADHFSEAVIEATAQSNHPLTIATANSCPFIDVHLKSRANPRSPCRPFVQETLAWLGTQPPGIVLVASSSTYWDNPVFSAGSTQQNMTNEQPSKNAFLESGLTSTVEQLQAAGHDVVLVQDVPFFTSPNSSDPEQFSALDIARGADLTVQMPVESANEVQKSARDAISRVADATGATVLDLRDHFCPAGICTTQLGDTYLYRDSGHISIAASKDLGQEFAAALNGR